MWEGGKREENGRERTRMSEEREWGREGEREKREGRETELGGEGDCHHPG